MGAIQFGPRLAASQFGSRLAASLLSSKCHARGLSAAAQLELRTPGTSFMGFRVHPRPGPVGQPEPVGRGFLGLELVDDKDAIVVKSVLADAPAAKAGLKAGDIVVNVKEKGIKNSDDLRKATADMKAGDSIKLSIKRAGEAKEITITAGEGL